MTAFVPNSVILYVSDVEASTAFYSRILGHGPIETYPGFSVFALSDDVTLGAYHPNDHQERLAHINGLMAARGV